MKFISAAALALFAAAPAFAAPTVIDFETAPSFVDIADHYAGLGVSFVGGAQGLQNDELGTYFSNAPSAVGVMFVAEGPVALNVAAGFTNEVSFSYSSSAVVGGAVNVWSGLDGTGTLLASFNLVGNAQFGCSDTAYCHFDKLTSSFFGTAHSLTFSADTTVAAFDNISITAVPEPTTWALMALGLAGVAGAARRRRG